MNKINIVEIGTVPSSAGIGGVSIHVSRLIDFLSENDKLNVILFDYKIKILTIKLLSILWKTNIIHIHVSNPYLRLFYIFLGKIMRCDVVCTYHGNIGKYNWMANKLVEFSIKLSDVPIVLNDNSYVKSSQWNNNTQIVSAFIPPLKEESLNNDIINKIQNIRKRYNIICSANAYNLKYDHNGSEIYNIFFLVNIFKTIPDKYLLISDPSASYKNYFQQNNITLPENIGIISEPHSFFEVLKLIDVFIRPTITDGDALSVKEALFLNKKVLCSDVVNRPNGVHIFKLNDSSNFIEELNNLLHKEQKNINENLCQIEKIISIYDNCYSKSII